LIPLVPLSLKVLHLAWKPFREEASAVGIPLVAVVLAYPLTVRVAVLADENDARSGTFVVATVVVSHSCRVLFASDQIDGYAETMFNYTISQKKRKRIEECFGWLKTIALMRKVRHRGVCKVHWIFTLACAAYNLVRMRNLAAAVGIA
jgi:hypothetical protein